MDNFPIDDASLKRPVIYAQPNKLHVFNKMFAANHAAIGQNNNGNDDDNDDHNNKKENYILPKGGFILVPAENVTKAW